MKSSYWKSNLVILASLLVIWFVVSFGFGILWSEKLDNFSIGGFKLGFWFSQQGSIYFFVLIIFIYVYLLNKLDKKYFDNSDQSKIEEE
jgi:putative solute:sodium symporter small subunit